MAIYSLNLGFISRSEGRSSVAFSAYISAGRHVDERTSVVHNYLNKEHVLVSRVLAPQRAPEWVMTPSLLWNKVEQFEDEIATLRFSGVFTDPLKQKKSAEARDRFLNSTQTAQTVMGALPIELSQDQAEACVEEFLQSRFVARGLVVQYAIHWDNGNPHFHALVTRRALVGDSFSQRKDRDIVSKVEHNITRKAWERVVNKHLALAGIDVRIDCRSNKDRGSLFLSGFHEGYYAQSLAEQGLYSRIVSDNEAVRARNIEIMCDSPEVLIHEVSSKRTTFTAQHLLEEIMRRVGGDTHLLAILKARVEGMDIAKVAVNQNYREGLDDLKHVAVKFTDSLLSNAELISPVGENMNRERVFTSTAYKQQEKKILTLADKLAACSSKILKIKQVEAALHKRDQELGYRLSPEQRAAVHHLCSGSDIRILNGRAGSGKTTLLKAVADAYTRAGYRVLGTGFQGKAVEIMEREIGIPCKTLDSFKFAWERCVQQEALVKSGKLWGKAKTYAVLKLKDLEKQHFTKKDVILVDEANMVGGGLWEVFLEEAVTRGAKVLIVQDTAQIKSREPGDYGRLFAERLGACETREVVRQRIGWQSECSRLLNTGNILDGLLPYHQKGHLHWHQSPYDMQSALVQDYLKSLNLHPTQTHIALAYRNLDVEVLNQAIRQKLIEQNALGHPFKINGQEFSIGDRIRFTQNDHTGWFVKNTSDNLLQFIKERFIPESRCGVKNGTFGTIVSYNKWTSMVQVKLDDTRQVKFNLKHYSHITLGYALGIHKSEGSTFDRTFVAFDPLLDPATCLVTMTRHKEDIKAYVNHDQIIDFKALVEKIGHTAFRETLQDYQVSDTQKPYLNRVQQYRDLVMESVTLREEMEGSLKPSEPLYKHASYPAYQACLHQKKEVAGLILNQWEQHHRYVRLAGIRRDALEVEVGSRPRLLSDLEHRASIQVQGYMEFTAKTRNLWNLIQQTHPGPRSKAHPLYGDYKTLKTERDSLAASFQENPKLYRPFLKTQKEGKTGELKDFWGTVIPEKDKVFWTTVKAHAKAHIQFQMQKLYEERLTSEQQTHYKVLKTYRETCREAASLYLTLKQEEDPIKNFSKFHEAQTKRDALAFQIVSSIEKYEQFFENLKISEEKLLEHATFGEVRSTAQSYLTAKDIKARAAYARDLQTLLSNKQNTISKLQRVLKQEKVDFKRISFDILFEGKLKEGLISEGHSSEYLFNHIRDYLTSSQEVAKSWKTKKPELLKETIQLRKDSALRLIANETALLLFKDLYPERTQKLEAHAGHVLHHKPYVEADKVLANLKGHYADLAIELLGEPNRFMSSTSFLRFGSNGKIMVNISGPKEGLWYDFSADGGGNIFQLIGREKGLDFKEAVQYCARFVNMPEETKERVHSRQAITRERSSDIGDDTAERIKAVFELQHKSKPIERTIAETYLRKERRIEGILAQDLRYLPKGISFTYKGEQKTLAQDCFAAFGRNNRGQLKNVQLTKLDQNGKRALSHEGEKLNKIQYGISKGAFINIQQSATQNSTNVRVFIAEGVETALSLKEAGLQGQIVASLGVHNIKNYEGPAKEVIICADNDGQDSQTHEVVKQAQEHFKGLGKSATIIRPEKEGQDFNDVLKKEGVKGVQTYLNSYTVQYMEQLKDPKVQKQREDLIKLATHLQKQLQTLKENPFAEDVKKDLMAHAKLFKKDPEQLQALHTHNPTLAKEVQKLIQQQRNKDIGR